jgi:hypothetical protein
MPTKTFQLNIIDGHAIIEENKNIILVDTGSPVTIHTQNIFNFMNYDFAVKESYAGITIPDLCGLLGTRITTLLGMDRLLYYKVIFDYPNNRITFCNDNNLKFEGERVTLTNVHKIPVIDVKFNQRTVPCFFDSGAKLSYLKAGETRNLPNLGEINDFYPGIGSFVSATYEIETQIGSKKFPVLYGNLPENVENQLLRLVDGNNGILGFDFLKTYKIYMDGLMNDFKISDSSPNDVQIPDSFENKMPDFMKFENIKKTNPKASSSESKTMQGARPEIDPDDPFRDPHPGINPRPKSSGTFLK